jgi:hypothetical protein
MEEGVSGRWMKSIIEILTRGRSGWKRVSARWS